MLGTVKNAALVVFCVVFLREQVSSLQGTGYTVALLGFSWYQYIKANGSGNIAGPAKMLKGTAHGDAKQSDRTGDGAVVDASVGERDYSDNAVNARKVERSSRTGDM